MADERLRVRADLGFMECAQMSESVSEPDESVGGAHEGSAKVRGKMKTSRTAELRER